jgi:hypothetical protein
MLCPCRIRVWPGVTSTFVCFIEKRKEMNKAEQRMTKKEHRKTNIEKRWLEYS